MPSVGAAIIGSSVIGAGASLFGSSRASSAQSRSPRRAARTQMAMFERTQELLRPYVEAGSGAVQQQQNYLGLNGPAAQAEFIDMVQASPGFQEMMQGGEDAILQNASATGGLRGGNTQRALAEFRPYFLNQQLMQRFNQLGELSSMGQASAANQAAHGANVANNVSGFQTQIGQARAGNALAQGQAIGGIANAIGTAGIISALSPSSGGSVGTANNTYGVLAPPAPVYGVPGAGTTFGPYGPQF